MITHSLCDVRTVEKILARSNRPVQKGEDQKKSFPLSATGDGPEPGRNEKGTQSDSQSALANVFCCVS